MPFFSLIIQILQLKQNFYWHEDKQTRNLVSFDPANLDVSEIYEGNVQFFNVTWHNYFLIPWHPFYGKRAKSLEKFFLQLWKCQEIYVQIQTFTDENWNILLNCSFEWY